MKKLAFLFMLIGIPLLAITPYTFAASTAIISLDPSSLQVAPEQQFTFRIVITPGDVPILAVTPQLLFDPGLLEFVTFDPSPDFPQITSQQEIGSSSAEITVSAPSIFSPVASSAVVAYATFTAKSNGTGTSNITFGPDSFAGSLQTGKQNIFSGPTGASISIVIPTTPTPRQTPTPQPTATPTPKPTITPTPTPTLQPTATPTPTPTMTPMPTPTPTIPKPTVTPAQTPTPSPKPHPTPTPRKKKKGPSVTIHTPYNKSMLPRQGSVAIRATASDRDKIRLMEITVNSKKVASCQKTTTCTYRWDVTKASGGSHTIAVTAWDQSAENNSTTQKITVVKSCRVGFFNHCMW
jgi:outer membrane biosynthesis protein TonB